MIFIHEKCIYLEYTDLPTIRTNGITCPICGVHWYSNGTGPSNNKTATWLLQKLPSNDVLGGEAPNAHDLAYLLCPEGWTVHVTINDDLSYTAFDKYSADLLYYNLMQYQVSHRASWYSRWWYYLQAKRNFKAVSMMGDDSFRHKH